MKLFQFFKKHTFLICSLLLVGILFVFHCWMAWPGQSYWDAPMMILLAKNGWHPALIVWMLEGMYALFGVHIYHLLLLYFIPFYFGIWLLMIAIYKKTKSYLSLLLCFPCFIANVYYLLFEMKSTSFSFGWVFLLYASTLYLILSEPKKKKFFILYSLIFIITLLSRHNAIFQVWPITFVWIGLYLKNKDLKLWPYLKRFIPLSIASGIFCLFLSGIGNQILSVSDNGNTYPATPTLIHQIVGACAPALDESCFSNDWWHPAWQNKPDRMLALDKKYREHPLDADFFASPFKNDIPFKYFTDLKGRFSKWFYGIKKYPFNYLLHVGRYYKAMWLQPVVLPSQGELLRHNYYKRFIDTSLKFNPASAREKAYRSELAYKIPESEFGIKWSDTQLRIDSELRKYLPKVDIIWFIGVNFVFFIIGIVLSIKKRDILFLFSITSAFAGILTGIMVPLFVPTPLPRYMMPVIICAIFAGIALMIKFCGHHLKKLQFKKITGNIIV